VKLPLSKMTRTDRKLPSTEATGCGKVAFSPLATLVLLLACAHEHIQPYGDKYIATHSSLWGQTEALNECVKDANEYCSRQGRRMLPASEEGHQPQNGRGRPSAVLVFWCVSPDDPSITGK